MSESSSANLPENIKIGVCGNVDSSKSSIISCLAHDKLDNGKGSARALITNLEHELVSGRTSALSHTHIKGKTHSVSLIDNPGHERYFKTTLFGLTGLFIDYGMVIVEPNKGLTKSSKEHLGVLIHMKIPFFIVLSKMDLTTVDKLKSVKEDIIKALKTGKKNAVFLDTDEKHIITEDYTKYSDIIQKADKIVPVLNVSCVTGHNMEILKSFIMLLKKRTHWEPETVDMTKSIFYIDTAYNVQHVGLVLSGYLKGKDIIVEDELYVGPLDIFNSKNKDVILSGNLFTRIKVKSLHNGVRENVNIISHEETGCICIKFLDKSINLTKHQIKKGMVILSNIDDCLSTKKEGETIGKHISTKFVAQTNILHHHTTITDSYSAMIHCGPIRQTAKLTLADGKIALRTGDKAEVTFEFMQRPEYLEIGAMFFFREQGVRGVGKIIHVL